MSTGMYSDKAKRQAFRLVWAMAQSDFDKGLLGVSTTQRRKTKQQCRAKFMQILGRAAIAKEKS